MKKTFLEITDMPTDRLQALGKLRTVLVGTFNSSREHKHKMTLLKEVLKFMYNKCVEFEKHAEAIEAKKAEVATSVTKPTVKAKETK